MKKNKKSPTPNLIVSKSEALNMEQFVMNALIDRQREVFDTNVCIVTPEHREQLAVVCLKRKKAYICFVCLPNARQWQKYSQNRFVRFARANGLFEALPDALKKVKTQDGAIVPIAGNGWALL